ncbi:archaellin/type IV pilin N-terminal domain-containing protein [Candidatus Aenigmatarchaeota archaeon]
MKGITPIIALILLLVIVIVVVGFAFGIFQGLISTAGESAQGQVTTTGENIQQTVSLENAYFFDAPLAANDDEWRISVRNQGTDDLDSSEVAVYIDGSLATCVWSPATIVSTSTCTVISPTASCVLDSSHDITATSPSGATQSTTAIMSSCDAA